MEINKGKLLHYLHGGKVTACTFTSTRTMAHVAATTAFAYPPAPAATLRRPRNYHGWQNKGSRRYEDKARRGVVSNPPTCLQSGEFVSQMYTNVPDSRTRHEPLYVRLAIIKPSRSSMAHVPPPPGVAHHI
eukprot:6213526-Pleurochrysis_carterae.AAC.3